MYCLSSPNKQQVAVLPLNFSNNPLDVSQPSPQFFTNQSINNNNFQLQQQQFKKLKKLISIKHEYDYSILFTQQLYKISLEYFIRNQYQALNKQFIEQFINNINQYQILRIGEHKIFIGNIKNNQTNKQTSYVRRNTNNNQQQQQQQQKQRQFSKQKYNNLTNNLTNNKNNKQPHKLSGNCIIIFKNGNIYQGQIKQNKRQGKGTFIQKSIGYFQGYFKNDIKQGYGIQVYYNKSAYKGTFINGLRQNISFYIDIHQNQYYGEWKLGIIHGKGTLKNKYSIYNGNFVNWLKHGHGQQIFSNGDIYKGQYQNNRFDGYGTYKYNNQAIYQGNFKNNHKHGKGKYTYKENKYLGNYIEGYKQGYGEIYYPNGNFYKGNFIKDKKQGYGEMFWIDGSFYKGQWKNGIQHGKGQIYIAGNQIITGLFQNSILVQTIQNNQYLKNNNINLTKQTYQNYSSQPRGILNSRNRTFSDNKNFNYRKKLVQIDQGLKKINHSTVKDRLYFKSPQKSDRSISKGNKTTTHKSHHHDGRQCKCVKRLENFRLKQKLKTKINDSRFNNNNNIDN